MIQYVVHILMENLCTKFHFTTDNRIVEMSCYSITVVPPVGRIVSKVTHVCSVAVCTTFPYLVVVEFSIEELWPGKSIRPHLKKFGNQLQTNSK